MVMVAPCSLRRFVLLGLPSSGKGTYGQLLSKKFGVPLISVSSLLKESFNGASNQLIQAAGKQRMLDGDLVEDRVVDKLVHSEVARLRANGEYGYILDGYPRTMPQYDEVMRWDRLMSPQLSIFLDVPEWVIREKMNGRRVCECCGKAWNVVAIKRDGWDLPEMLHNKQSKFCKCGGKLKDRLDDMSNKSISNRIRAYESSTMGVIRAFRKSGTLIAWRPFKGVQGVTELYNLIEGSAGSLGQP